MNIAEARLCLLLHSVFGLENATLTHMLLHSGSPLALAEGGAPLWRELGLSIGSNEPASIDILSVRIVSKEAPFSDAAVGLSSGDMEELPALYIRAPGRIDFTVEVPNEGRLDLALGVLRDDAPVTFGVSVTSTDGRTEQLLDVLWADRTEWAARSFDLAGFAGEFDGTPLGTS